MIILEFLVSYEPSQQDTSEQELTQISIKNNETKSTIHGLWAGIYQWLLHNSHPSRQLHVQS